MRNVTPYKPHSKQARAARLCPGGVPRWIRVYDNGGTGVESGFIDRYTVLFTGHYTHKTGGEHQCLAMNECPFHPQGFGQHCGYPGQCDTIGKNDRYGEVWPPAIGRKCHLGTRITFQDLPKDCQIAVLDDYCDLWDLDRKQFRPRIREASVSVLTR